MWNDIADIPTNYQTRTHSQPLTVLSVLIRLIYMCCHVVYNHQNFSSPQAPCLGIHQAYMAIPASPFLGPVQQRQSRAVLAGDYPGQQWELSCAWCELYAIVWAKTNKFVLVSQIKYWRCWCTTSPQLLVLRNQSWLWGRPQRTEHTRSVELYPKLHLSKGRGKRNVLGNGTKNPMALRFFRFTWIL